MIRNYLRCLLLAALVALHAPLILGADVTLVRVPNGGIQPQAAMDHDGVLHLLYFSGEPSHGDLYYTKSSDEGRTWAVALRVNSQPGSAIASGTIRGGQLALGRHGLVHVAWNGSSLAEPKGPVNPEAERAGEPMLYSRLNESHTAFERQRNLMTRTFGLDGGGTLAADRTGHVYVAWHAKTLGAAEGEAGRQVWITRSDNEGKTFTAEQPAWSEPTGACGCCGMAMYADGEGVLRVLYRSATENIHRDLYVLTSRDNGRSFDGRKLHTWDINACPMTSMSFAASGNDVEGAWETGGQVYFESLSTGEAPPVSGLAGGSVISAPGEGKNRKHPRLAKSSDGTTLMAWTEGTGWARGGSMAWQLFDSTGTPISTKGMAAGLPTWSFGSVVSKPGGFVILY